MELDARHERLEVQQTEINGLVSRLAEAERRLDVLSAGDARLATELGLSEDKVARLKQSWIFRFARKIGLFDFF